MTALVKKIISYSIKSAIVICAYVFIYRSISNKDELQRFVVLIRSLHNGRVYLVMGSVVFLMLINWFLEALKWRYLAAKLKRMSVWQAVEAVYCGLTWAIFTPNRFGEYGGRIMFLPPAKRVYGIFTMGIGAFGQNVITNTMGSLAFIWFLIQYSGFNPLVVYGLSALLSTFAIFMVLCFYNISWLAFIIKKVKPLRKFERFFAILSHYDNTELSLVLLFCIARFIVFSAEYYLVIHLLIPGLPLFSIIMMVFNMFFIQSALPTLDIIDVGLRGTTASFFFAYITSQKLAVIAGVSSIWFINLIVPAIIGSVFVFNIKFFDRTT